MTTVVQGAPVIGPQPTKNIGGSETYSRNILGPVSFKMDNLKVYGSAGDPLLPDFVAPEQSPFIVASNEKFTLSVDIEFNQTPLSSLLMCLGTKISVSFALEGLGNRAELDLTTMQKTSKGTYKYTMKIDTTPELVNMAAGLYAIAAVATIGPSDHPCSQHVLGYAYVAGVVLQVYAA